METRAPLGGLVRDAQETTFRYEREVTTRIFPSLETCITYAVQEELGSSWGVYQNDRGFRLYQSTGTNTPQGFVRRCPPLPPPPPPPKWSGYCGYCGGVIWAGELSCSVCGWNGTGWED